MYESHYGLTAKPFSIVPNSEFLFLSENHENALTYLEYGLSEKVGFILLTGEIGAGKTTLIRYMLNKIGSQTDVAVIFNTNFTTTQLFRRILCEFEIPCDTGGKENHLEVLYQYLIDRYAQGRHVLLIIDEAQNLSNGSLEDIRMLSNLQTDNHTLLQIMLVGQPELKVRLDQANFRQLAQRIAVNYHISPLDMEQTQRYIAYRLQKAGGSPELFTPEAIDRIYKISGGIPRTINLICDTALVYGFADSLKCIDVAVIEKVIEDKVCMGVGGGKAVGGTASAFSDSAGPRIMERIERLETSISELKRQHEDFAEKVKSNLLLKHQRLLATERKRYDQLMEKYIHLLQLGHAQNEDVRQKVAIEDSDTPGRKIEAGTKFAHLLKMVEANKRSDTKEE